jgi:hypothetical protein
MSRETICCCVDEVQSPFVVKSRPPTPGASPSNHSPHCTQFNLLLRDSRRVLRSLISADSKQNRSEANVRSFEDALTYEAVIPTLYENMDIQADKSSSLTSTGSASLLHSSGDGALAHSEFDSG